MEAILNSRGLSTFHAQTSSEISITMLAGDSSGWQKANSPDARNLDPAALAETAARKARDSASPREVPPGKYTVILEPAAVLDLVGFMFLDFGGLAILDQRSFLNNRVGTKLFGENITVATTCTTRCNRARRSTAKACVASVSSWSRTAWSGTWCMPAPPPRR